MFDTIRRKLLNVTKSYLSYILPMVFATLHILCSLLQSTVDSSDDLHTNFSLRK